MQTVVHKVEIETFIKWKTKKILRFINPTWWLLWPCVLLPVLENVGETNGNVDWRWRGHWETLQGGLREVGGWRLKNRASINILEGRFGEKKWSFGLNSCVIKWLLSAHINSLSRVIFQVKSIIFIIIIPAASCFTVLTILDLKMSSRPDSRLYWLGTLRRWTISKSVRTPGPWHSPVYIRLHFCWTWTNMGTWLKAQDKKEQSFLGIKRPVDSHILVTEHQAQLWIIISQITTRSKSCKERWGEKREEMRREDIREEEKGKERKRKEKKRNGWGERDNNEGPLGSHFSPAAQRPPTDAMWLVLLLGPSLIGILSRDFFWGSRLPPTLMRKTKKKEKTCQPLLDRHMETELRSRLHLDSLMIASQLVPGVMTTNSRRPYLQVTVRYS